MGKLKAAQFAQPPPQHDQYPPEGGDYFGNAQNYYYDGPYYDNPAEDLDYGDSPAVGDPEVEDECEIGEIVDVNNKQRTKDLNSADSGCAWRRNSEQI